MARANLIKLKTLKQTRNFYLWELKKEESLTESEKSKYLLALKSINKIIQEKENSGEKEKHKKQYSRIIGEVTKKYNPGGPAYFSRVLRIAGPCSLGLSISTREKAKNLRS